MINLQILGETISEAWESSLRLFVAENNIHRYDSMRGPCNEIDNLLISISKPQKEPIISNLFPKDLHLLIDDYSDELLKVKTSDSSTVNYRIHKWMLRNGSSLDQLEMVKNSLIKNPESRYNIIGFWDPELDPLRKNPVSPISINFKINNGKMNLTVIIRTLDAWIGATPLFIGFLKLQEYLISATRSQCGSLTFFIFSYHIYEMDLPIINRLVI